MPATPLEQYNVLKLEAMEIASDPRASEVHKILARIFLSVDALKHDGPGHSYDPCICCNDLHNLLYREIVPGWRH